MSSLSFETYLKSIQKNLQKGSERSHYPALKNLLDNPSDGIDVVIEEKGSKKNLRILKAPRPLWERGLG